MVPDSTMNTMLDAVVVTHVGLATAYPGASGANEVSGGTYARKATTPAAAAARQRELVPTAVTFDVPAGVTAKWIVAWSAVTGGVCRAIGPLGSSKQLVATVQAADDIFRSDAHTLVNDSKVVFIPIANESLPAGITEGTDYFVVNATADTFQVSVTQGGAAINLTTDGEVAVFDIVPSVPDVSAYQIQIPNNGFPLDGRFLKIN